MATLVEYPVYQTSPKRHKCARHSSLKDASYCAPSSTRAEQKVARCSSSIFDDTKGRSLARPLRRSSQRAHWCKVFGKCRCQPSRKSRHKPNSTAATLRLQFHDCSLVDWGADRYVAKVERRLSEPFKRKSSDRVDVVILSCRFGRSSSRKRVSFGTHCLLELRREWTA